MNHSFNFIFFAFVVVTACFPGCKPDKGYDMIAMNREPAIEPDYSGVTIPQNIAPMNFLIREDGDFFIVSVKNPKGTIHRFESGDRTIQFPLRKWKEILSGSQGGKIEFEVISMGKDGRAEKYDPFYMDISREIVDPYLCYRLLYPGYESWVELKIEQRSTESFKKSSVFENQLLDNNCVNCHSFIQNNPGRFLLHVRGSLGGTYFVDGEDVIRKNLQAEKMPANAVYPSWHPTGKYVVFSSNKTVQSFHMRPEKNIEVFDLFSSLVIYNTESNKMYACEESDTAKYMETFPFWSPEGDYLYYCRTDQVKENFDFRNVKYDLLRRPFDQSSGIFGNAEIIFNAGEINKSVSFPSLSPDGQYLVFTLHDYGTFSIWHKEADLYLLDLKSRKVERMNLNSDETESYHSWSSNSRWLVFSSKRGDGLTARPYLAYFGSPEKTGKPFILPQKDPSLYERMAQTFNRPEFLTGRISTSPRDFAKASKKEPVKAIWATKNPLSQ